MHTTVFFGLFRSSIKPIKFYIFNPKIMIVKKLIFFLSLNNNLWTLAEDEFLKFFVKKYGLYKWYKISTIFLYKTQQDCIHRWYYWVSSRIKKTIWNRFEDKKLVLMIKNFQSQWNAISFFLGRNYIQCVFRFILFQYSKKFLENQIINTKKNAFFYNNTLTKSKLCSNIRFIRTMFIRENLNYLKIKLRCINRSKKKNFKKLPKFKKKNSFTISNLSLYNYHCTFFQEKPISFQDEIHLLKKLDFFIFTQFYLTSLIVHRIIAQFYEALKNKFSNFYYFHFFHFYGLYKGDLDHVFYRGRRFCECLFRYIELNHFKILKIKFQISTKIYLEYFSKNILNIFDQKKIEKRYVHFVFPILCTYLEKQNLKFLTSLLNYKVLRLIQTYNINLVNNLLNKVGCL
nr:cell division cycle 5-like protein [Cryptomonas sp.]